ncbi:MAG: hypothetical protein GY699_11695 [Desulfobacteraceae bacterium]|nr:hypothetical protein [Desulfobacteraceae bacterium]
MYLLVNVLEQTEHLPAILEDFSRLNIKGSTVINSTGMGACFNADRCCNARD